MKPDTYSRAARLALTTVLLMLCVAHWLLPTTPAAARHPAPRETTASAAYAIWLEQRAATLTPPTPQIVASSPASTPEHLLHTLQGVPRAVPVAPGRWRLTDHPASKGTYANPE